MSTVYICAGCGIEMERYEDDGPYVERPECLCSKCISNESAFDAAFAAYETNQEEEDACLACGGTGARQGDYGAEADGWCESCEGTGKADRAPEDKTHPESYCHRCGGPNRSWSAPSPLWNAVMRGGSISGKDEFDGIVCPTCFIALADERGIASGWRLDALEVAVELEMVTPSGRTWDGERWMWVDAPDRAPSEAETVARALMKRWIDQANAERYVGGPNTSPMVEPEEYDIDDPPDGMEEQARLDAEAVIAALAGRGRSRDDTVTLAEVKAWLESLRYEWLAAEFEDWFSAGRAEDKPPPAKDPTQ